MSGYVFLTTVVGVMALTSLALLVVALRQGRRAPLRTAPWVIALVMTAIPALFITVVAFASMSHIGIDAWPALGALGLWALVALTVFRARWAAWVYLATGIAFPIVLAIGDLLLPADEPLMIEPANALGFYTARAVITAGLLLWATHEAPHRSASPHMIATSQ